MVQVDAQAGSIGWGSRVSGANLAATRGEIRLSEAARGDRGRIVRVGLDPRIDGVAAHGSIDPAELERRLLEFGFVEGARVEILHEGAIGRDPIAIRLDDMRIALRRREAQFVLLRLEAEPPR